MPVDSRAARVDREMGQLARRASAPQDTPLRDRLPKWIYSRSRRTTHVQLSLSSSASSTHSISNSTRCLRFLLCLCACGAAALGFDFALWKLLAVLLSKE
jgi:hypothetical protein